jgi:membrane protein YqaA with SNARE-associated domain
MTRTTPEPTPSLSASAPAAPFTGRDLIWPVLRLIAGLVVMLLVVGTLAHWARPQCEALARGFVSSYGYWGMALGTLLADGFHFPIPPQFYMLLSIASRASIPASLVVIVAASLVAGVVGYGGARLVGKNAWVAARTERSRRLLERAVSRFGARAALIASLLPIPYSILCYLAGLNRMPLRFLLLLCLCRIPKLMAFYLLVYWGWQQA